MRSSQWGPLSVPGPVRWLIVILILGAWLSGGTQARAAKLNEKEVQSGYRQILALLAGGDHEGALDELATFETDTLGPAPGVGRLDEFWRYKLRVISELMKVGSLDLLVPIMVLHHDAYPLYVETHRAILASHSRTMAMELADLYSQEAGTPEAGRLSAGLLSSLAGHHQKGMNLQGANTLFAHALELDPRSEAAAMGLATNYEKNGQYEEAIPHLERAVRINPANHEARLRMALCTKRLDEYGKDEEGRQILLKMLRHEDELTPWIHSLVYQELANLNVATERADEAEQVLRRGLERFPGDQHLQVRLVMVLNRIGRRSEAAELLATVEPQETSDSPRRRYNSPPMELIEVQRVAIKTAVRSRLPLLAASLGQAPPADEAKAP